MGWMSDNNAKMGELLRGVVEPLVPPGETLAGCVYANQQSTFSAKLFALGVTEQHLIIQQVDRKWKADGTPVLLTPSQIDVGNIFSDGAAWTLGDKDQQIRFTAAGEKYKFNVLGGTMLENALAGESQVDGLQALVGFLQRAKPS